MKVLLDTNILGRLANASDPQQNLANDAVTHLRAAGYFPCVVPQCFYEFWAVATRPEVQNGFGISPADVLTLIRQFSGFFLFHEDAPAIYAEWERLAAKYSVVGKNAHDARLVAAMLVHGMTHLLTFNLADFRRYAEITAISPTEALRIPISSP